MVVMKAAALSQEFRQKSQSAQYACVRRFLKAHSLSYVMGSRESKKNHELQPDSGSAKKYDGEEEGCESATDEEQRASDPPLKENKSQSMTETLQQVSHCIP